MHAFRAAKMPFHRKRIGKKKALNDIARAPQGRR
jgi:hypothetical protein